MFVRIEYIKQLEKLFLTLDCLDNDNRVASNRSIREWFYYTSGLFIYIDFEQQFYKVMDLHASSVPESAYEEKTLSFDEFMMILNVSDL